MDSSSSTLSQLSLQAFADWNHNLCCLKLGTYYLLRGIKLYEMLDVNVSFQDTSGICSLIGHRKKIFFCHLKKHSSLKKKTLFIFPPKCLYLKNIISLAFLKQLNNKHTF